MQFRYPSITLATVLLVMAPLSPAQSDDHARDHAAHMAAQSAAPAAATAPVGMPALVSYPAALRDRTLTNMRDHLLALTEIQEQLATQHYDAAAEVAEQRLGMSSLKLHGAHEVMEYMPAGMQQAGAAMHHAASRFALTAQESAIDRDMGKSLAALAELMRACVACHAAYRLK